MSDPTRILLIDDDEDSYVIVRKLLDGAAASQYDLEWAPTFEEGLTRLADSPYAAVLIDYRLGAHDGLELLDEAVARGLTTPVIMLTGQGRREVDVEAMRRGASDYLAKDRLDGEVIDRAIRYAVERGRLTDALRRHIGELARRTEDLQRMNEDMEQLMWAASHDLQTPLRTIVYRLQHLRRTQDGETGDHEAIESATEAAKRMSVLLNDLLDYVRLSTVDFVTAPVSCDELVGGVAGDFATEAREPLPQIDVAPLPTVVANEGMLTQVFKSLVGTAIERSSGKPPRVRIGASHDDGGWTFRIEHDGAAIDPDDARRIFEPFRRSPSHDPCGSGIGLALCRRIVERHGGRIWCAPQSGAGAAFLFTIPDSGAPAGGKDYANASRAA